MSILRSQEVIAKMASITKIGLPIGPIPTDWVWLGLIGSIAKIGSWIRTDGNRQNHVTTSPSTRAIGTAWESQAQLLISSLAFYQ
jgi:hypothetical protein